MKSAVWSSEELSSIQNKDRLLPSQPYFSKMYNGADFYGDMEQMLGSMYSPLKLDIKTKDGMTYAVMGSDLNTLRFYQFMIRSHGYKKVLELGTYIGVSAMYMAAAGAQVSTVEKGAEFWRIAEFNVRKNKMLLKIKLWHTDAKKFFIKANGKYDFILIDCAKECYKELLELSMSRLDENGMILVDDVFFQGETLSNPTSEKGKGVKAMLDYVATLEDWDKMILPIGNGLFMMRRK